MEYMKFLVVNKDGFTLHRVVSCCYKILCFHWLGYIMVCHFFRMLSELPNVTA